jgi:hypothetical protein
MPPAAAFIASSAGARKNAFEKSKFARVVRRVIEEDEPDVLEIGVKRKTMLAVLKARRRRMVQCRSIPFGLLSYSLFLWAMFVHVNVSTSFDIERG